MRTKRFKNNLRQTQGKLIFSNLRRTHGAPNFICVLTKPRQISVHSKPYPNCSHMAQRMFAAPSTHTRIWFANSSHVHTGLYVSFCVHFCVHLFAIVYVRRIRLSVLCVVYFYVPLRCIYTMPRGRMQHTAALPHGKSCSVYAANAIAST